MGAQARIQNPSVPSNPARGVLLGTGLDPDTVRRWAAEFWWEAWYGAPREKIVFIGPEAFAADLCEAVLRLAIENFENDGQSGVEGPWLVPLVRGVGPAPYRRARDLIRRFIRDPEHHTRWEREFWSVGFQLPDRFELSLLFDGRGI